MQTNWFVFTGAPCAGKTTTVELLKNLNYPTNPEIIGSFLTQIRKQHHFETDTEVFQYLNSQRGSEELVDGRIAIEESLDPTQAITLDRSMLDTLAYYRLNQSAITAEYADKMSKHANQFRYRAVFHFELLPVMVFNGERIEEEEQRRFLDLEFYRIYTRFNYHVIRIAVASIQDRLAKVIKIMHDINETPSIPKLICKIYPTLFAVDTLVKRDTDTAVLPLNYLTPAFETKQSAVTYRNNISIYGFFKIDLTHEDNVTVVELDDKRSKKPIYFINRTLGSDEFMSIGL